MTPDREGERRRALHFLSPGPVRVAASRANGLLLLDGGERGQVAVSSRCLRALHREGLVARRGAWLHLADGVSCASAYEPVNGTEEISESTRGPSVNLAGSPLAVLARMKDRDGATWLSTEELAAGERLRADFTHGGLSPRLGVNWHSAGTSGGRGAAELADSVVAARQRFNRALGAVGPELSGVLVDVCCFLKGLGTVEAERGWPARSAKLLLKTALAALARHYRPREARSGTRAWGAPDYRPRLDRSGMPG